MWNFAGRQNDIQGQGEIEHGNWITGIPVIDKFLVGDQSLLPSDLKNNKGIMYSTVCLFYSDLSVCSGRLTK